MVNTHSLVRTGSPTASHAAGEAPIGAAAPASEPRSAGGVVPPDARSLRSEHSRDPGPPAIRLAVTGRARRALTRMCQEDGPQVLVLSWPAGATVLPAAVFAPSPFDVIIGHVAGCPMHADVRQLDFYHDRHAVLDAPRWAMRAHPTLRLHSSPDVLPPAAAGPVGSDQRAHIGVRR
jgi:hypothetical protein